MSAKRLHTLATLYLAVVYGVVGFTGDSLHYLATDWSTFWGSASVTETDGYYHVHGPDYHVHFHRHGHSGHMHGGKEIAVKAGHAKHRLAIGNSSSSHRPHACPLLSLVASLRLCHTLCQTPPAFIDTFSKQLFERELARELRLALSSSARGPPMAEVA